MSATTINGLSQKSSLGRRWPDSSILYGAGIDKDIVGASLKAVMSAVNWVGG